MSQDVTRHYAVIPQIALCACSANTDKRFPNALHKYQPNNDVHSDEKRTTCLGEANEFLLIEVAQLPAYLRIVERSDFDLKPQECDDTPPANFTQSKISAAKKCYEKIGK